MKTRSVIPVQVMRLDQSTSPPAVLSDPEAVLSPPHCSVAAAPAGLEDLNTTNTVVTCTLSNVKSFVGQSSYKLCSHQFLWRQPA